jgi:hypothetical protein
LAGRAFADALNRLGIANQVRFESKLIQGLGTDVVTAVASGAAAIGAAPTNNLPPPPDGIDILGPLPTDIVISAGVLAKAQSPAAALGFHQIPGLACRRQSHRCPWDGALGQRQQCFERSAARPGTNFLPQAPCTHTKLLCFPSWLAIC